MASTINASTSSGLVNTADTSGVLQLQTANTTAMTVTAAQLVGIGTASPSGKLHVSGGANPQIVFDDAASRTYGIGVTVSAMSFYDVTGAAERMRIDSSGNVGIGTNSPTQKLDVAGNAFLTFAGSSNYLYFQQTANYVGRNGTSGDIWLNSVNGQKVILGVNNTARLTITNSNLALDGGNTSANGTGITFPATQSASSDANCLDDYEEGTWTPTATPNSGSLTSYTSWGNYTKIGKFIYLSGAIEFTNVGTASNTLIVGGLPFTTQNAVQRPCVSSVREDQSTGVIYAAFLNGNATTGVITTLTNGGIAYTNGYRYTFSLYYLTA
jgi:hypothetical protein